LTAKAPGRARAYLELTRPPNLVTAAADVLAGYAVAGLPAIARLPWLVGAGICLYAGGVALNDVCDAEADAVERPERPIPSGRIGRGAALRFAVALLGAGCVLATAAAPASGALALAIAAAASLYDAWGKHRPVLGPLTMGLCRGLNLLLGVSAAPAALGERWPIAAIPILYIAGITAVSRGEVAGGDRRAAAVALVLLGLAGGGLVALWRSPGARAWAALPFLALLAARVAPPFVRAYRTPNATACRAAVKAGVLSLIAVDATLAATFAGPIYGGGVLALALLSAPLARRFAVT